jgi:hypothetical protein
VTAQESYAPQVDEREDQPVVQSDGDYRRFFDEIPEDE